MNAKLDRPTDHSNPGKFPTPKRGSDDVVKHLLGVVAAIIELTDEYGVREVGRQANISHSTLSRTVNGEIWPSSVTIARLEAAFDCSLWR